MNKNRPKLLLAIICVMILFEAGRWLNKRYSCGPKTIYATKQIKGLTDTLAIREIILFKSHPGHKVNLISDTVTIDDPEKLMEIQNIIGRSKHREREHPISVWSVNLKIVFLNNEHLIMAVNKIRNDSINTMTHFWFPQNTCPGDAPYYSIKLGTYLEQIVSFEGITYK